MSSSDRDTECSETSDTPHLWKRAQVKQSLFGIGKGCLVILFGVGMWLSHRVLSFDLVSCIPHALDKSRGATGGGNTVGQALCATPDVQMIVLIGSLTVGILGALLVLRSTDSLRRSLTSG